MESSTNSRAGPPQAGRSQASVGVSTGVTGASVNMVTVVRDVGLIEHSYEGEQRYCDCGFKAPWWTSWKPWSIGRRFYGCPNFLDKVYTQDLKCPYFVWHDLELQPERAIELLKLLITEKKAVTVEVTALRRQLRDRTGGGAGVESSQAIARSNVDSIPDLEAIIEETVSNVVNDVVERKLDALITASVGSEVKKLRVHIVFGVFILMVMSLLLKGLF